jgi:aldehyde dehydrogenase (NAD+)/betaine-aldehyde dehydrogenase
LYIDGEWIEGDGEAQPVIDPSRGAQLGTIHAASLAQVERAILAARRSFDSGVWSRRAPAERAMVLRRLNALMGEYREALIELFIVEGGCPRSLARSLNMDQPIEHLAWIAGRAEAGPVGGWLQSLATDPWARTKGFIEREPYGVVSAFTPYNVPYIAYVWKVAMALAAGCSICLLPSPRAQLSALAFVRLVERAGAPAGVVNLLFGGPPVGRVLADHDEVDMVTFTGSNAVGAEVMRLAARTAKRVLLELGGKSPNILLPGIDCSVAALPSLRRLFRNAGQGCAVTSRILVAREDYARFVKIAREVLPQIRVGDPWQEDCWVGPLISSEHQGRVERAVADALAHGARIEAGGGRPEKLAAGYYMNPVLLGGVDNTSTIAQTELFGPVGVLIPYDSLDEAASIANQTRYGLNANVWGEETQAIAFARRIRSGNVSINGGGAQRADVSFGGYKQSGTGGEGGERGFEEFLQFKHIIVPA